MHQAGLFDEEIAYDRLDKCPDPLLRLNAVIDWELFRTRLQTIRKNSGTGRRAFDEVLMFKILILQSLYNLADDAMEYLLRDRLSFMRFLGLNLRDRIPDAKTIWLFREQLTKAELTKSLFDEFDGYLRAHGFRAQSGQIVDATIVPVPIQRNRLEENEQIKSGQTPESWTEKQKEQKDTDARFTKKGNRSYYGYKDHVDVDVEHKFIRNYEVTPANVHDSQVFEELLDLDNDSREVYGDSAYFASELTKHVVLLGLFPLMNIRGVKGKKPSAYAKAVNRKRSKVRSRVEHVFGAMKQKMHDIVMRGIGITRAKTNIGLRNLAYNLTRYSYLCERKTV
jgi:IS5 family transposase